MANNVFRVKDKKTGEIFTVREKVRQDVPESGIERQNLIGSLFNVPGAAIRSAIFGKGYAAGAAQPSSVPTFQETAATAASNVAGMLPPKAAPIAASVLSPSWQLAGMAADVVTQPADVAAMLAGKVPGTAQAAKAIGSLAMKIKPVAAMSRFLNKPRYVKAVKDALGGKINAIDDIANQFVSAAKNMRREFISKWQPEVDDAVVKISKSVKTPIITDDIAFMIDDAIDANPDIAGKNKLIEMADTFRKSSKNAKQLQDMKNRINIPKSVRSGKSTPNQSQSVKMKILHEIDNKILDLGGSEYQGIKDRYREMSRAYADTMSVFMEGNYPGGAKVTKPFLAPGFGISPRQTRSLGQVSKYGADPMAAFNAWRIAESAKRIGLGTVGAGLLYGSRKRVGEIVLPTEEE